MLAAPLTLGTAGHIDHGKTTLIGLLTGAQTDRLPQERERGISIELGYAALTLPSGRRVSVVDAPGHERFVRTMVAGASGIDFYLMVVAADDGVMPQTREHAIVLEALAVKAGVVAVTKADVADPAVAMIEAGELLPEAEVVAISARTGEGLDELRAALDRAAAGLPGRARAAASPRLHVDRVFTIRGAGTVVTGTLWSGSVGRGDEVVLLPSGRRARIRAVQVHDQSRDRAPAGQRVAVNLAGVAREEVQRGDVLTSAAAELLPSYLIDARLRFPAGTEPQPGTRVQVHHGTRETPGRLAWLGGEFWQVRLERPLVPAAGDRLVIRQIAPPDTLGGGVVLDARPRKHGPSRELLVRLQRLERGDPADEEPTTVDTGERPHRRGSRPPAPTVRLSPAALAIEQRLKDAGFEPPLDSELAAPHDLASVREAGRAVRVSKTLHYHPDVLAEIRNRLLDIAQRNGGVITIALLRDELRTSRKFAQALLEHFDAEKLTLRRGDEHILRGSAPPR